MTKEELRKEATSTVEWECTPMIDRPTFINGYITGAKPRERRIAELEKENAELKKHNGELAGQKASLMRWFGEAKSIIRELMNTQPPLENVYDIGKFDIDDYRDAIARAESFLKE